MRKTTWTGPMCESRSVVGDPSRISGYPGRRIDSHWGEAPVSAREGSVGPLDRGKSYTQSPRDERMNLIFSRRNWRISLDILRPRKDSSIRTEIECAQFNCRTSFPASPDGRAAIYTLFLPDYRVPKEPERIDLDFGHIAGLQIHRGNAGVSDAWWSSCEDQIPGLKGEDQRQIRNQLRHGEDHLLGVA